MDSLTMEATVLEEAVCSSKEKELRVHCHATSGRGWVEVSGRRFVGREYVLAAKSLHAHQRLDLKHEDATRTVYELGHHVCSKAATR